MERDSQMTDVVSITDEAKGRLITKLRHEPEVIRFADEPALAPLCACLALQFEMGNKDFDRLSPFFGVDVSGVSSSPWDSEIISAEGEFGLRLWLKDGGRLSPRHEDLCHILDPLSLDDEGALSQVVIFPGKVARYFNSKGFDLIIVRDWLLTSSLNPDSEATVPYLVTNPWEIENNIAFRQARMMVNKQLAFFGTHDIVDHLLDADCSQFNLLGNLFEDVLDSYKKVFSGKKPARKQLLVSYLIGVLLDDLAQPKWYNSEGHEALTRIALGTLENRHSESDNPGPLELPRPFHELVSTLRSNPTRLDRIGTAYTSFAGCL